MTHDTLRDVVFSNTSVCSKNIVPNPEILAVVFGIRSVFTGAYNWESEYNVKLNKIWNLYENVIVHEDSYLSLTWICGENHDVLC